MGSLYLFNALKIQIAASAIILVLEVIYFLRPKLSLLSTKVFTALMIVSAVYLVFDFATVLGLIYFDTIPHWLVDLFHRIYIIALDDTLILIYIYLDIITKNEKRLRLSKLIFIIATEVFSVVMLFVAPIYYHIGEDGMYSYGPMVWSIYFILFVYFVMTVYKSIKCIVKGIDTHTSKYVLFTMIAWAVIGIIQFLNKAILISSLGLALILLTMILSMENPSENIENETFCFNYLALRKIAQEYLFRKKPFDIINIDLEELPAIQNQFGDELTNEMLIGMKTYLEKELKTKAYRLGKTSFMFFIKEKKFDKIDIYLSVIEKRFKHKWKVNGIACNFKTHIDFIRCPYDFPFDGKVSELLTFIEECHTYSDDNSFVHKVDAALIEKKHRQEIVLKVLKEAIENDGIDMVYQPIYSFEEKKFTNVEALVRLKDTSTIGFISPEEFIPLAEKYYLISDLSQKIFDKIFNFMSLHNLKSRCVNHVEINLSALQSVDAALPNILLDLLSRYSIEPSVVNLEITESIAITSGYMLKKNMSELRRYGCTFSMDDFGTGYSNLSQIAKANFELIKIDKSLLWPVFDVNNRDKETAKILLENIITMLKKMNKKIVVEGVETKEQFEYLQRLGVHYIQGYFFSKPLKASSFVDFVSEKNV